VATTIQFQDLRISLIWVETNVALLNNATPPGVPWPFLGQSLQYAQKFDEMLYAAAKPTGLIPPWDKAERTSFWTYYTEGRLATITGANAWNLLIPFRRRMEPVPSAPWFSGRFYCDGFFYPHGLGLMITAILTTPPKGAPYDLDGAVKAAFQARTQPFQVSWPNRPAVSQTLDQFARQHLNEMRALALGKAVGEGKLMQPPFTVVTVVRGVGSDRDALPGGDPAVLKALWGLASWSSSYQADALPDFGLASLHIKRSPPNHVLYSQTRGRVIWFPTKFADPSPAKPSLSCYHRNLVFNTLQVESLGGLVADTADKVRTHVSALGWKQQGAAVNASKVLGRAYGGKGTYASCSSHVQIADVGLENDIDVVRTTFGSLPPLDRTNPWASPAPPQVPVAAPGPTPPQPGGSAGAAPHAPAP